MEYMEKHFNGFSNNCAVTDTKRLSESQIHDAEQLAGLCCRHDRISLSYPAEESSGARHWLVYDDNKMLIAALGLVYYDDTLAECTAFTHPAFRRRGLFSSLLKLAAEDCGDCDILFPVSGSCPDTAAVLEALGAELTSREYQMETELTVPAAEKTGANASAKSRFFLDSTGHSKDLEMTVWHLFSASSPTSPRGTCQTSLISDSSVCLHHVEILPQFRKQGCGTALMNLLFSALHKKGIRRVMLQVSGDNEAALALYKKTGFRITETLSYYLY